jgi:hypothetical protein
MAYVNLNFVPGEILTAAKMNLLAANDASFHDGTGIGDGSIQPDKLADSLKTYKSTEMDTGKKWIDGRQIYRKVVRGVVNMIGGNNTSILPHGITGLTNAWELISWSGNMRLSGVLSNNPIKQALPYIEGTHQAGITSIDKTNITISGSYAWGSSEVSVTMEYVK